MVRLGFQRADRETNKGPVQLQLEEQAVGFVKGNRKKIKGNSESTIGGLTLTVAGGGFY